MNETESQQIQEQHEMVVLPETPTTANSPIPVFPQLTVALSLLAIVFGITYIGAVGAISKSDTSDIDDIRVDAELKAYTKKTESLASVFNDISLQAQGAMVWDVRNQRAIFNKNGDEQLPLASITKLMTALVAYELLDPDTRIMITNKAIKADGDSGFVDGESFSLQELTDLTLISSSNDGATALGMAVGNSVLEGADAESVFVKAMNLRAEEMGLVHTYFKNSTGLDISETEAGAYGSARDVTHLLEYIITHIPDAVALTSAEVTTIPNASGKYHIAKNTNAAVSEIDGLIASKTGSTPLAGGNLVVAVNVGLNRPLIIAVLGSTQEGRFEDTLQLITRSREYIERESR